MRVLVTSDKFKDALSAEEACTAIKEGIKQYDPTIETLEIPLADGGEGTSFILTTINKGTFTTTEVHDPLFRKIEARWGFNENEKTAYIEMAEASGLRLLKEIERDCKKTSTYGTGELIKAALHLNVKKIILCIGGSATNDGGVGMAAALGYRFLDLHGTELKPTGENLIKIKEIDTRYVDQRIKEVEFLTACDVENPLLGKDGAAKTFARQKGASDSDIDLLEKGLKNLASLCKEQLNVDVENLTGAGAAGGLGAGTAAFLKARICSGAKLVIQQTNFEERLKNIDLLTTGEGKLDNSSFNGKIPGYLASLAEKHQIPLTIFTGKSELEENYHHKGQYNIISISEKENSLQEALAHTRENLTKAAYLFIKDFISIHPK